MSLFVVDVESDGPAPGLFSMISIGIVKIEQDLAKAPTFFGQFAPISDKWIPEALAISEISRDQHLEYPDPAVIVPEMVAWVLEKNAPKTRPVFLSDNLAYDWQWMNYYTNAYAGGNPFGFSGRRIGDFYAGLERDFFATSKWKKLRQTKHTHNPVDDARGNAEALVALCKTHRITLPKE